MFIENELIWWLVVFTGLVCLLYGVFVLFSVSFLAWGVVRLPRLERMCEKEEDVQKQRILARKIRLWRAYLNAFERGAEGEGVDMSANTLLKVMLDKHPHFITRALLLCLAGTASLLWAFGYFGR